MIFDLMEQRWLPVELVNGSSDEVGLRDVLLEARKLRRLAAETPTMTAALYRLILALAHRVYGPADTDAWEKVWKDGFTAGPLERYLTDYPDRFDLFDSQRPFLQCPPLAKCPPSSVAKLVLDRASGNNVTLFDHTTSAEQITLEAGQAARWLVTVHAYDPGGTKTPYQNVKSSIRGLANYFGVVVVEGGTLHETLMLNMPIYNPKRGQPQPTAVQDQPAWESAAFPNPEPDQRSSQGWTDLLTWQSRRILLLPRESETGPVVAGVVIAPGTELRDELAGVELMSAFRRPPRKPRQKKWEEFRPVRLDERRGVWRHTETLLLAGDEHQRRRPRALDHIAELVEDGVISDDTVYTLRVFGQRLGAQAAVVQSWSEEAVAAPVALLRAQHEPAGPIIGHAVDLADQVAEALRAMESDYAAAMQVERDSTVDLAYWARLPGPFDGFLRALGEARRRQQSEATAIESWARSVRQLATATADRWANGSPRTGRSLSEAGRVFGQFTGKLHRLTDVFIAQAKQFINKEALT
ncbi:type I-E CRISPR-associated protein Cse1/CasA [Planobispora takensis]|uniref:Type I-E CRISPR-associated protein Cse1/CasA n=1 Tax=Planobispora takensis TaxID=1367882 RepID=A0A8J3T4D7_9ACTN|nr:type I-E CRISPR-associated protein Cse1/CasA [Planobispora takensis]GII05488.1 type I-E CRISPR-associated protein Cse1/CasA [Planobispora takensis]